MENRYTFGGFTFGSEKLFQLTIRATKPSGYGYSLEIGLELTTEERMELIKMLMNAEDKDAE